MKILYMLYVLCYIQVNIYLCNSNIIRGLSDGAKEQINNYETIALLLEHCNHENGIYNFYIFKN